MINCLISIIIPTYNRAHLIAETLDSVLAQTYTNWECIVVDDGSTDDTPEVMARYCKADTRFQYYHRPKDRTKGANTCRNYGFEISKGEYINWFDSDDLMELDFLFNKINYLFKYQLDFVVSKTLFFNQSNVIRKPDYHLLNETITLKKFICKNQFWLTLDGLFKKSTINGVKWNENLKSGQEFNFICKYLMLKNKGLFLNKFLAKARIHDNSIHSSQNKSKVEFGTNKFKAYFITYKELKQSKIFEEENKEVKNKLFISFISHAYNLSKIKKRIPFQTELIYELFCYKGFFKTISFMFSLFLAFLFKRGYQLMNYSRN